MTKLYKPLATILLTAIFTAGYAQKTRTACLKKTSSFSETESRAQPEKRISQFVPNVPAENAAYYGKPTAIADQIHSPIRWHAIELADDAGYWQNVNYQRVWLELEIGQSLANPEIAAFISDFQIGEPDKRSMHPNLSNFYVFDRPETTPEEFIEMALAAKSVTGILFLEPAFIRKAKFIPNDPLVYNQWGLSAINAPEAWDYGTGGQSLNVMAVVDDAVDWMHEDLSNQVNYGYDFANNDGDVYPDTDQQYHGTHVTGIMAATINNGIGVAGMCNDTVYFAKVTDATYTHGAAYSPEAMINAINTLAGIDRVTVINLSIGGGAPSSAEEQAYNNAWNSGKLLVVPSGNDATGTINYPGVYASCMAVGALGTNGMEFHLAGYSNFGAEQEVSAPGGEIQFDSGILSTMPNNLYNHYQGTSMASSLVAGLAGLMKSLNPILTNADIRYIINATCTDLGEPGWDAQYGHGMINAQAAVEMAVLSVSAAEKQHSGKLTIYPNPSNQQFWIKGIEAFGQGNIEIYDLSGKLVKTETVTAQNLQSISVSDLPEGVYIVQVKSDHKVITGKFVKAR